MLPTLVWCACSAPAPEAIEVAQPVYAADGARLELALAPGLIDGSLAVELDGRDVTDHFAVGASRASGELQVDRGPHLVQARGLFREGQRARWREDVALFFTPAPLPAVAFSEPAPRAVDVPRSEWIRLAFARDLPDDAAHGLELRCDGERLPISVEVLDRRELLLNPEGELPPAAACRVAWRGASGTASLEFRTAGSGLPATVRYDRTRPTQTAPFPDDYWLFEGGDGEAARLSVGFVGFPADDQMFLDALARATRGLDGFSPIGHLTVELSEAPDPASLPRTPAESLEPTASVGLFDVDPQSERYGERVPFRLEIRADAKGGTPRHALLVFPSIPLESHGRYGLVVTRRARAHAARPFDPSLFFLYARDAAPSPGEPEAVRRVRELAGDVLDAVATAAHPPIPRDDVALAVRFTVRGTDSIPADLLALRADVTRAPAPEVHIESVRPEHPAALEAGSAVAAVVTGTWEAPDWRGADLTLARDPATGRPLRMGTRPIGFVLALPEVALDEPVPVTLYQHGNPGSAQEEVVAHARQGLAQAGFAVIGFTDVLNREVSPPGGEIQARAEAQWIDLFLRLMLFGKAPDHFVQTNGEQLAFLRAVQEIARIPAFELDGPPDEDPTVLFGLDPQLPLTYVGVSEGANLAPALLPYAPEIRAAALVAGGRRFGETLLHQQADAVLAQLHHLGLEGLSAVDVWVALALLQSVLDDQDAHNHARFLYRSPLDLAEGDARASVLLIEGLDDRFVPNHATESLAWALGPLPILDSAARVPVFAEVRRAPLSGNVSSDTSAALAQYVPEGIDGVAPTPGCREPRVSAATASEGHWCAQSAAESLRQRVIFLESALSEPAPIIVDPTRE